jgi:hypothetical protein
LLFESNVFFFPFVLLVIDELPEGDLFLVIALFLCNVEFLEILYMLFFLLQSELDALLKLPVSQLGVPEFTEQ